MSSDPGSGIKIRDDLEQSRALLAEYKEIVSVRQAEADRFTAQARQAFLYVTTFFTITQAAAVVSLNQHLGSGAAHAVVAIALASSLGMVATGYCAFATEHLREYGAVGRKFLDTTPNEAAKYKISVEHQLYRGYKMEARLLDDVHLKKLYWLKRAQVASALTFLLIAGELITALVERL